MAFGGWARCSGWALRVGVSIWLALLTAVTVGPRPAAAEEPRAALATPDFFGVVGRDPWYEFDPVTGQPKRAFQEAMARNIAATGARWTRIEFHTAYQSAGLRIAGDINFAETDLFVNELAPRYGLKVLALLNTGILSDQPPFSYAVKDLLDPARRDRYIDAFVDRAREIAARYAGRIGAYEIVNEPNVNNELGATTGYKNQEIPPEVYASLLARTYTAIRGVDGGGAIIVGGLLKGVPIERPSRYTTNYLQAVYAAPAVVAYRNANGRYPFDGVGLHPYPNAALPQSQWLNDTLGLVAAVAGVIAAAGDPGRIWITEIGVKATPAAQPVAPATASEAFQAAWLRDLFTALATTHAGRVARAFWFKFEDFPPGSQAETWGLARLRPGPTAGGYDPGGAVQRAKPAYAALHELAFAPASAWLFAEGFTGIGFDEYLTIQNPGATAALVAVTYLPTGAAPVLRGLLVAPNSRATVAAHELAAGVGRGWATAARVWASQPVVVERPMYFSYGPGWTGGHVALGVAAPGPRWYFAEGYTGTGFDQYLTIMNPNGAAANLRLTYYRKGAAPLVRTRSVPPGARVTVAVHDAAEGVGRNGGRGWEVATLVESTNGVGVVVERPIYFAYGGSMGAVTGGHTTPGATAPRAAWHFAEGYTGVGFDQYLTILNPNASPAGVAIRYFLRGGQTIDKQVAVPASAALHDRRPRGRRGRGARPGGRRHRHDDQPRRDRRRTPDVLPLRRRRRRRP